MTGLVGIDFGTTNSVVSVLHADGSLQTRSLEIGGKTLDTFRTLLCFWSEEDRKGASLHHAAGPFAISSYLDDPLSSRLIMSMKTYLAQRSFTQTKIFGKAFTLEALVASFLRALLGEDFAGYKVVAGRPVRFAGDFGGGTSDFSVIRFDQRVTPLGYAGVGIAGDVFDYRIIDHVVSPLLGKHDTYTSMGNRLPVPPDYFTEWIAADVRRFEGAVDEALQRARLPAEAIDRVFLTGGTSFVPRVRRLFEERFGADKVSGGGEFVSVAEGLALIGRDRKL